MLKPTPALGTTRAGMVLVVALAGCAQVFDIEPWADSSSGTGGAGGAGQGSTSVGSSGQSSSQSASVGPGGGPSSSQSASVGPGGGPSSSQSASVGPGGGPSSSQSASVGVGQGGATMGVEVCTNGADDDNDGDIDCADSDCTAFKCVPPVPSDWEGFVEIYVGPPGQAPACSTGFTNAENWLTGNLSAPPASCQCSCQPATGGNCLVTLPDDEFTLYNDAICSVIISITTPPLEEESKGEKERE